MEPPLTPKEGELGSINKMAFWQQVFAVMLPLFTIFATICIQKVALEGGASEYSLERQTAQNWVFVNRTCGPLLSRARLPPPPPNSRAAHAEESAIRLVVGAGFAASGLNSLSSVLQRVPGACKPSRTSLGFWSTLGASSSGNGHGRRTEVDDEGDDALLGVAAPAWGLPPEAATRQRYLRDLQLREGQCSVPWEVTERYTSISRGHSSPPAVCTPLAIRHHFPSARVLLMLADPVRRAHAQQTLWLHNRCYRDAREAAKTRPEQLLKTRHGRKGGHSSGPSTARKAKGEAAAATHPAGVARASRAPHRPGARSPSRSALAAPSAFSAALTPVPALRGLAGAAAGCELFTAEEQLRLELDCMRGCSLQPDSPVSDLLRCASLCSKALRTALACKVRVPLRPNPAVPEHLPLAHAHARSVA